MTSNMSQPSHQCTRPSLLKRKRTYTDDEENDPALYDRIQTLPQQFTGPAEGVPEMMLSPDSVTSSELCEAEPMHSSGQITPMDSEGSQLTGQCARYQGPLMERLLPLPDLSWADPQEVWDLMCHKDEISVGQRDDDLFRRHPCLTARMRSILLDWLIEVCEVYKLHRETYHLTVDFIDRYLSSGEDIPKQQLQLIGITCLFIASKVEEIYPPKIAEFAYVTDGACTESEILDKELAVLKTLQWNLSPMTAHGWLSMYLQLCRTWPAEGKPDTFVFPQFSRQAFVQASQLLDLCMLDDGALRYPYSVLATAAFFHTCSQDLAVYVSGLRWDDIEACVRWMSAFASTLQEEGPVQPGGPELMPWDETGCSGLLKSVPRILVDDSHNIQTHSVDLKLLERAQQRLVDMYVQSVDCEQQEECVESEEQVQSEEHVESEESIHCPRTPASGLLTPPSSHKKATEQHSNNSGSYT